MGDSPNLPTQLVGHIWFPEISAFEIMGEREGRILATKRVFVENTSSNDLPAILDSLRRERINAPGGGMFESDAVLLVEDEQITAAIQVLRRLGLKPRVD